MVEVEELEPLSPAEEEGEEDISYDDLKRRMWKDRNLMEKLKQQKRQSNDVVSLASHRAEASRRKKMARSQDSVLKYMMKIMEVCKTKGFVYGIVPEKGKPITGSSDSLRRWWKETVQFDQTAPNATSRFQKIKKLRGPRPREKVILWNRLSEFTLAKTRVVLRVMGVLDSWTRTQGRVMRSSVSTGPRHKNRCELERMQPEFNSSRRFDDDEDNAMVLNQSPESNQSDNVSQSTFSVWDMGCEDKDIYMFDY
ncbi:hypothetical protein F2Q68_00000323 [Brassica cretica]|uniref:Ethylene insensitive 3-like DNA-binding domain-containing protein n=2 Tax=Brassica cretica TaxID=69181 RepID=A0ABQ7BW40_BRACR|nr:hypothetical protein F2Q68_00000323 [Brassica cretica]KAF3543719.1 hypothetical protein DY000_02000430 [Brassica cretica]